jgi:dienelactone hydrolase
VNPCLRFRVGGIGWLAVLLVGGSVLAGGSSRRDASRVLPPGVAPDDARLGKQRTLNDGDHAWSPPATKDAWEREAGRIRTQLLVSNGLWPLWPRTPLEPVVHGRIDRDGYTIEKVYFASLPGHYVTGSLYRPTGSSGKHPGVLCPHGHWRDGRFYDAGEAEAQRQIESGAEQHTAGARYPLQARMVQLAKLGCVVFHYDMVGYADSLQIPHREEFNDAQASLRLQNKMGLQTWNSIRALDFLLALPDVDAERIGVTGASGGGTQTFMLCAVDPRPAAAFPAVMVSTAMQGGCVCENADYLRQGINNIAIASVFAPKPLAMSGADDWTIAIETKGLPELRQVYALYGAADRVQAKCWPQFKHNYNQVAREMMYAWFNEHLELGHEGPIQEADFKPVPPRELSVWNDAHPVPADAKSAAQVREYLTGVAEEQLAALVPEDAGEMSEYRRVIGAAARVMLDEGIPPAETVDVKASEGEGGPSGSRLKAVVARKGTGEAIPVIVLAPAGETRGTVLWIDGKGKSQLFGDDGAPIPAVRRLLASGYGVVSGDVFLTGEFVGSEDQPPLPKVNETYSGYTFGYNRPVLSNRVRDVLTLVGSVRKSRKSGPVRLVGTGGAGVWVLLAAALAGDAVEQTVVDLQGFSFSGVESTSDPNFLPGALKYGGLGGLAALAAPAKLTIAGASGLSAAERGPLEAAYRIAGGERLTLIQDSLSPAAIAELLPAAPGAAGQ